MSWPEGKRSARDQNAQGVGLRLEPEVLAVAREVAAIVRRVIPDPQHRVFLFGSWASGGARARSDIDIGIAGPGAVDPAAMLEVREACDGLATLYTVEIVDLARVPARFRSEAMAQIVELEPA